MAETSIVEIQVNDAQFNAFAEKLERFRKNSAGGPGSGGSGGDASSFAAKFKKSVEDTIKPYKELQKATHDIASNIQKATNNLLKWSGIASVFGLISGAGGFFGIDRLAQAAAFERKSASGSGVTIGEQNAFRINQNRFLNNPDAMLTRVNELNNSFEKYKLKRILGHGTEGMTNVQIAEEANLKAHAAFGAAHGNFDVLKAQGYGELYSNDELQRLGTRSEADIRNANDQTNKDIGKVGLNDASADKWQEFLNTLDRASASIKNNLIDALTPLAGPLGRIVTSFGDLATALIKAPAFEHFVGFVADGFGKLATYIGTPKFEQDMLGFVDGIDKAAKSFLDLIKSINDAVGGLQGIADFLNKLTGADPNKKQGDDPSKPNYDPASDTKLPGYSRFSDPNSFFYIPGTNSNRTGFNLGLPNGGGPDTAGGALSGPGQFRLGDGASAPNPAGLPTDKVQRAAAILARDGYTPNQISGLLANVGAESSFDQNEYGDGGRGSSSEAFGLGQWHPDRQADFKAAFGHDIHGSSFDEQVEFMNYELHHKENRAMEELQKATTRYGAGYAVSKYYERPRAVEEAASNRGRSAEGQYAIPPVAKVTINNNTGGNANANVNGLVVNPQ